MDYCEKFIENCEKKLPDPCTVNDLVSVGIYCSAQRAAYARRSGQGPDYMILPHKRIIYPRKAVIKYLKQSYIIKKCIERKEHAASC